MIELPNTLAGYRALMRSNQIDPLDAYAFQRRQFVQLASRYHFAVDLYDRKPLLHKPYSGAALAHKDIFEQDNRSPGQGIRRGVAHARSQQSNLLSRLKLAGFADLGALSMTPLACSSVAEPILTSRKTQQTCLNPLDDNWAVGGSSSGSACAVASGAIYGSLGSDTAGSVRIPAFTCGVMGLKPTFGLIRKHGIKTLCPSLDTTGILTRSAHDADILLEVIANRNLLVKAKPLPAQYNVTSWIPDPVQRDSSQRDACELEGHIAQILNAFAQDFKHTIHEGSLAFVDQTASLQTILMNEEIGSSHQKDILNQRAIAAIAELGTMGLVAPIEWVHYAQRARSQFVHAFVDTHLKHTDILITPAYAYSIPDVNEVTLKAPQFNARKRVGLHQFTSFVNYLGLPALVMPIARDAMGKPVSIQLIAKPFHERTLIAYATHIENLIFGEKGILPSFFLTRQSHHEQNTSQ